MPSFVQIKQQDVQSKVEEELMSSDESVYDLLSLEDSDASSDDDVRSLSPEEIIVSSDGSDNEESIPHPPDSDVSIPVMKSNFWMKRHQRVMERVMQKSTMK